MDIRHHVTADLGQLKAALALLTPQQYTQPLQVLSHTSISAHVRHILEFYICLLRKNDGVVSYDSRDRSEKLEGDLIFVQRVIDEVILSIRAATKDFALTLRANFSTEKKDPASFSTTFFRELVYCLEHSVHHQAIIKIGFNELFNESQLPENFGIAASTVRHQVMT